MPTCISGHQDLSKNARYKTSIEACKTRTILQPEQAIQILQIKLSSRRLADSGKPQRLHPSAAAKQYGISEKAVRDIWNGRTWLRETMHLDPSLAPLASRFRPPGRPRRNEKSPIGIKFLPDFDDVNMTKVRFENQDRWDGPQRLISDYFSRTFLSAAENSAGWSEALLPLPPPSSSADDPFHDDWIN